MKIEVIMSAYNNVVDLNIVLDAYLRQEYNNYSLCVADDGSDLSVGKLVETFKKKGMNIRHVWHKDRGYRRAKILNKAIQSSEAQYIIFTDSDCIPAPDFIADHKKTASKKHYTTGVRVYLKEDISNQLRSENLPVSKLFSIFWLLLKSIQGKVSKSEQAIRYPNWLLQLIMKLKKQMSSFGSNIAMTRESLLKINGFDEDYEGWGCEDKDLLWRLEETGLTQQGEFGKCCQYHLHHKKTTENPMAKTLYLQKQKIGHIECLNGIRKIAIANN
jgi:glycosyltransferase involved in cell wall biosynthesis